MAAFAIKASHFVMPAGLRGEGYLVVEDGRIAGYTSEEPSCAVLDRTGCWVAPGLVDTHIHGYCNHATTDGDAAGLVEASVELARRGTTSWLPTTFTDSAERIGEACAAIADVRDLQARRSAEDPVSARIQGIYLEGPFFTLKHVGAQNPALLLDPSYELFERWQRRARGLVRKSALAPERDGACAYVSRLREEGVACALGHSDASYEQTLAAVDAGASVFVHTYNGMRGLHHREPGVLGCAMTARQTYAELICDGHHVAPAAALALVRAKGWDHVALVTDCLGCGGMPEGEYMSGGLPVVMRDGVCYLADMSSIAGSVLCLAEAVRNVVDWGIVTAEQALRMATEAPARSAGIDGLCGLLAIGRAADLVVLEEDMGVRETYVGGVRA